MESVDASSIRSDPNLEGRPAMRVMVIEDELGIREILRELLEEEGFQVVCLEKASSILEDLARHSPDILLLDQVLSGKPGVEALREIRASKRWARLPVIVVTGLAGEDDRVGALNFGADDYVTKPFYPRELAARIRALARRTDVGQLAQRIYAEGLEIDYTAHRVLLQGRTLALTLTEFKILSELLQQSGKVLTREKLRERALGNLNVTDRTIDVHMAALRKKLSTLGSRIETVRGVGYRYSPQQ